MSDNSLMTLGNRLPSTQLGGDEIYGDLAKGSDFLGRLQLFTKGNAINRRLIAPGEYGIPVSEDEVIVLGDSVDVMPLARRPKAIDMSDKDAIITNYDAHSEVFKGIAARSGEQDSGCMYGISFLVIERTTGRFLEFFAGTKTARTEAGKIFGFLPINQEAIDALAARGQDVSKLEPHGPLAMTLKVRLIEKGSFSWHGPVVLKCSTPFLNLPTEEKAIAEIEKFLTVKDEGVEKVEEPANKKSKRSR